MLLERSNFEMLMKRVEMKKKNPYTLWGSQFTLHVPNRINE